MGVYSDVIDSTVLNHIKIGKVDTSNNVFKLFCNISPAIFWICSALVVASSYIGDPIKCMSKNDIAETVCWLHGTYHIEEGLIEEIYGKPCKRSYDTYGSQLSIDERKVVVLYIGSLEYCKTYQIDSISQINGHHNPEFLLKKEIRTKHVDSTGNP